MFVFPSPEVRPPPEGSQDLSVRVMIKEEVQGFFGEILDTFISFWPQTVTK